MTKLVITIDMKDEPSDGREQLTWGRVRKLIDNKTTLEQIREQPLGVPFRIATFDYTYTRLAYGQLLYTDRFGNPSTIRPESEGGWGTCYYDIKEV